MFWSPMCMWYNHRKVFQYKGKASLFKDLGFSSYTFEECLLHLISLVADFDFYLLVSVYFLAGLMASLKSFLFISNLKEAMNGKTHFLPEKKKRKEKSIAFWKFFISPLYFACSSCNRNTELLMKLFACCYFTAKLCYIFMAEQLASWTGDRKKQVKLASSIGIIVDAHVLIRVDGPDS